MERSANSQHHPVCRVTNSKPVKGKPVFVLNVLENSNLSLMETGMTRVLDDMSINIRKMPAGHGILFINRAKTYGKFIISSGGPHPVIVAKRLPKDMRATHTPYIMLMEMAVAIGQEQGLEFSKPLENALLSPAKRVRDVTPKTKRGKR